MGNNHRQLFGRYTYTAEVRNVHIAGQGQLHCPSDPLKAVERCLTCRGVFARLT